LDLRPEAWSNARGEALLFAAGKLLFRATRSRYAGNATRKPAHIAAAFIKASF
jgi:hypothetical protein